MKCDKHPRYDPANGDAGIKGGCEDCLWTLNGYRAALKMAADLAGIRGVRVTGGKALEKEIKRQIPKIA